MNHELIADRLLELGHGTRLAIYRLLVNAKDKVLCVGDIQKKLDIPASTLSHHLSRLTSVGLLLQSRQGCSICCQPNYDALNEVIHYLQRECCDKNSCVEV